MGLATFNEDSAIAKSLAQREATEAANQQLDEEDYQLIKEYLHELRFLPDQLVFRGMVRPYTPMEEALDYFSGNDDVTQKEFINLALKYYDKDRSARDLLNKYFFWKLEQRRNW